jgi:hypothetical protein
MTVVDASVTTISRRDRYGPSGPQCGVLRLLKASTLLLTPPAPFSYYQLAKAVVRKDGEVSIAMND